MKKKYDALIILAIVIAAMVVLFLLFVGLGALLHDSDPNSGFQTDAPLMFDKPIIYLYPEEETEISVTLGKPDNITHSYPKYVDGWNVMAESTGELMDLDTGRNLYSLYYEADSDVEFKVEKDGFVVKGEDISCFLEEKLAILGLNEREIEEFIIYWLPILESNEYNYIRFATFEEIETAMPLTITPVPDTTIRVLMLFKGLDEPMDVEEQMLIPVERNGYVAVEWGGSEIK